MFSGKEANMIHQAENTYWINALETPFEVLWLIE